MIDILTRDEIEMLQSLVVDAMNEAIENQEPIAVTERLEESYMKLGSKLGNDNRQELAIALYGLEWMDYVGEEEVIHVEGDS
jgi:hypothetical protein